jgi:predicted O-methyltransferase YrrM
MKYEPNQSNPNQFLIDITCAGISGAFHQRIESADPQRSDYKYVNLFPGEHYRFIKSVVDFLKPSIVVEIGTFTGLGALSIVEGNFQGNVHTFDLIPWNQLPTHLEEVDFEYAVTQHIEDLSDDEVFEEYIDLLNGADIIFMDAPKDGVFEPKMIENFKSLQPKDGRLLIMDDIILDDAMVKLWRSIRAPKIDLTSLCHWSGTGLVDLSQPNQL